MLLTPIVLLGLSSAALVFGIALALWGKRGKPIDEHPVCRKCKFDLVGRPPESERCPECGSDLRGRNAIAVGNRKKRPFALVIGGCIVLLAVCVFGGWGWIRISYVKEVDKPTWLVLLDARSSNVDLRSTALWELWGRQTDGKLSQSQINAYIDVLIPLFHDADQDVRNDAMSKLRDVGAANRRVIPTLVALLRVPDPPKNETADPLSLPATVGDYAANLLDDLGTPGKQAMLKEVLGASPVVLKHSLSNPSEFDDLKDERIAKLLLDAVGSDDEELSKSADSAIGRWDNFPAGPGLAGLRNPNRKIRITCVAMLHFLDKPPTDAQIQPLLHDPNPDVQIIAEVALAELHNWPSDPKVESFLIGVLGDTHGVCRRWAADALSNYKDQASIRALALAMREVGSELALNALLSLEWIGNEAALDAIMDIIDDLPPGSGDRKCTELVANRMVHGSYRGHPILEETRSRESTCIECSTLSRPRQNGAKYTWATIYLQAGRGRLRQKGAAHSLRRQM